MVRVGAHLCGVYYGDYESLWTLPSSSTRTKRAFSRSSPILYLRFSRKYAGVILLFRKNFVNKISLIFARECLMVSRYLSAVMLNCGGMKKKKKLRKIMHMGGNLTSTRIFMYSLIFQVPSCFGALFYTFASL